MFKDKKNIFLAVMGIIILAGIVMFCIKGLNYNLSYGKNSSISINMGKDVNTNEIKQLTEEVVGNKANVRTINESNSFILITVKEISELIGISIRALRYYDEIGLLVPTDRTDAGYRLYDDEALEKLRAILFLKELDIPLDTIKEMVNAKNCDYGAVLKNYRKNIVQKINRLQGLLGVVDGMELEGAPISFKAFKVEDAEKVTETIVRSQDMDDSVISEISELVKANMVDGKVGIELLQIYGSRENYLCAVDESQQHPEVTEKLQEELKNIYFSFRDSTGENSEMLELVKQLENNTKKMFLTANARYILLKIAEGYLANDKTAQVLDSLYGVGVTATIGKAINEYYGV